MLSKFSYEILEEIPLSGTFRVSCFSILKEIEQKYVIWKTISVVGPTNDTTISLQSVLLYKHGNSVINNLLYKADFFCYEETFCCWNEFVQKMERMLFNLWVQLASISIMWKFNVRDMSCTYEVIYWFNYLVTFPTFHKM